MHSLFWKILLSFWVALIVFSAATVWTASEYLEHERAQQFVTNPQQRLVQHLHAAQEIAEHRGIEGLKQWAREIDRREAVPFLLLDENGEDLLGRPVPPRMAERMQRAMGYMRRNSHDEHEERENEHRLPRYLRYVVHIPGNGIVRLAPDYQSITLGRVLSRPRVIALPVIVAALISGFVALLLARYLTAPIARLRVASRKLAEGDLAQRVAPSMGSRRDEIADLAGDFDYMAERLQALVASHKQLLRDASHELRSPLARLQVALGLTRQRAGDELTSQLDRMEKEIEDLNELIGQLLSLARLETGTAALPHEPLDLGAMLETIADDAAFEAHARKRDVRILASTPFTVVGNSALLHSAIENVVRNAVRHTAEGSCVEIVLERDPGRAGFCRITVRDYGPGIPEDMLTRIFEPFTRVDEARDRQRGGYGLGLAIADRAVRLHGGTLVARNNADGGATMVFSLPVADSSPA
jgi:two-component system sensor histidine kinase CpxA